jgi:hypothetical protein
MTTIMLFKNYEQGLFHSIQKMLLHSFHVKQHNPVVLMILQIPVKDHLHMVLSLYENLNSGFPSMV